MAGSLPEDSPPWVDRLFSRLENLESRFEKHIDDGRDSLDKLPSVQAQSILVTSRIEALENRSKGFIDAFPNLQAHQTIQDQRLSELEQIVTSVIHELREGIRILGIEQKNNTKMLTEHIRSENRDQLKIFATTASSFLGIVILLALTFFR